MRSSFVNDSYLLTPFGEWLAKRVPHLERRKGLWGNPLNYVFRVYGFGPFYRFCLFDYTRMVVRTPEPPLRRLSILSFTLFDEIKADEIASMAKMIARRDEVQRLIALYKAQETILNQVRARARRLKVWETISQLR